MIEFRDHRPVIIIGAARSGTKILRDVLGASADTACIPFDVNYIWRTGNEKSPSDVLDVVDCTEDLRRRIRTSIFKAAGIQQRQTDRIVVEKTVSNCLRVPFVRRVFPEARFVHLVRDGRDVAESARRMWEAPLDRRYLLKKLKYFPWSNLRYVSWFAWNRLRQFLPVTSGDESRVAIWGPRYPGIERALSTEPILRVCARQWRICVESALEGTERDQSGNWLQLRYEDFVGNEREIMRVAEFIGIKDIDPVLEKYRSEVRCDLGGRWKSLDHDEIEQIRSELGDTLSRLGYENE